MAGRITGITGEINGSTTGLQDVGCFKIVALADIDLGILPFFLWYKQITKTVSRILFLVNCVSV